MGASFPGRLMGRVPDSHASRAALIHGDSRAQNVYQSLKLIESDIKKGLAGKKRVVIKPNMVSTERQLSATHAECIEGILEFLMPLGPEELIVAESAAGSPAADGYSNYGYYALKKKYPVKFIDLDDQPYNIRHVIDEKYRPRPVRVSRLLQDPDVYLISAAVMKTHDRVVVTLGLKNVAVGGVIKDGGYRWGRGSRGKSDKPMVHGGRGNAGIHYNLFKMSRITRPHLTVLDGFQAMEGNGPVGGSPVDHRVAVASTDWVAADRIGVELMGFDFNRIGYLKFSAQEKLGEGDLEKIEVLGEKVRDHIRKYRPHRNIESQWREF